MTNASRIILSNRQENLSLLLEFIRRWARDRRLSATRQASLEKVAGAIFQHLLSSVYRPGEPGSIAISLQEKEPRLCVLFEDDAPPHDPADLLAVAAPAQCPAPKAPHPEGWRHLVESLIYYRTTDRKNRLVVFLS